VTREELRALAADLRRQLDAVDDVLADPEANLVHVDRWLRRLTHISDRKRDARNWIELFAVIQRADVLARVYELNDSHAIGRAQESMRDQALAARIPKDLALAALAAYRERSTNVGAVGKPRTYDEALNDLARAIGMQPMSLEATRKRRSRG
jgi:hypothetical protein